MRPLATNVYTHGSKLHVTVRSKAVEIWKALQAKLQALLKNAKPLTQKYLVKLQVRITSKGILQSQIPCCCSKLLSVVIVLLLCRIQS